ncbi:hypothetical protein BGZ76_010606 [Entomortierella beljakovae]|nr:hypothetical protein BGZ76_010606 [Entomortierella beljakovae]
MSTARPARASARQSAQRQQALEIEQEAERQRILSRNSHPNKVNGNGDGGAHSPSTSSRSLSLALSDSGSLSSGDNSNDSDSNDVSTSIKQDQSNQDPSKPFSDPDLQTCWEVAFVYGFMIKFKALLKQNCPLQEFSIEDLEAGLLSKSTSICIEEIHANLLSNLLNRKKAVEGSTWQKVLSETLDIKYRTGEMEYDQNLLKYYGDYYLIPPLDRVQILKALVHWVLQEAVVVRQGIDEDNEHYAIEPFGSDQTRQGSLRIFRETRNSKKKTSTWETIATNLDEIKTLAASFEGTVSKSEKALQTRLLEEIIQPTEEKAIQHKLRLERQEKRMHKLAELHQLAATRTTRTRSSNRLNQPKYTFDDDENEFEDEYYLYDRPRSRRRHSNDYDTTTAPELPAPDITHLNSQQDFVRERSASAEDGGSSSRSSVGRDSDTSIRVALQRTRVGDEDGSFIAYSDRSSLDRQEELGETEQTISIELNVPEYTSTIPSSVFESVIIPPKPEPILTEDIDMMNTD